MDSSADKWFCNALLPGRLAVSQAGTVRKVTWIALAANVLLAVGKLAAGLFGNSQAVVADGVHSVSDIASDVALLVGVRYWAQPSDRGHPYGHGRIETLITWCVGLGLAATGAALGYRAISTLPDKSAGPPGMVALVAALASMALKETLYQYTVATGRRIRSSALVANAWHQRSDALSSLPTALGVLGAMVYPSWVFLDNAAAVFVCAVVIFAAWRIVAPATRELVDGAPSQGYREAVMEAIKEYPQVKTAHALRLRCAGSRVLMDVHIMVDPELTVREGHNVAEGLETKLLQSFSDVSDIIIHVEPAEQASSD